MFGGKKKKILSEGVQARAVVINVQDTGVTINDNPRVKLTFQVQPEGKSRSRRRRRRRCRGCRSRASAISSSSATTRPTRPTSSSTPPPQTP